MKNINKILVILAIVAVVVCLFFVAEKISAPKIFVAPLISEKSQTQYSTSDASYPRSSATKLPEVFDFVQKSEKDFADDVAAITPAEAEATDLGGDRIYNLTITTQIATSTKTVSYIIYVYTFEGGAHGETNVATFTYDAGGKFLTLGDIFVSPYLPEISNLARTYFYDTIDDGYLDKDMVDSGTAPTAENYSAWYLTDKNIVFVFQQYQVGPGALGVQEFTVDKNSVADIISPKYK
jgi:hypothetical protein